MIMNFLSQLIRMHTSNNVRQNQARGRWLEPRKKYLIQLLPRVYEGLTIPAPWLLSLVNCIGILWQMRKCWSLWALLRAILVGSITGSFYHLSFSEMVCKKVIGAVEWGGEGSLLAMFVTLYRQAQYTI